MNNNNFQTMKNIFLLLLFFSIAVFADDPVLEDFAQGYELITDGSGAIYRVPLPATVYQNVARDDLGDIRIFNSEKQRIPHAIRLQETRATEQVTRLELPFFPLQGEPDTSGGDDMNISIAENGRIVNIQYKSSATQTGQGITRYIIDLSGVQQNVDVLEFELTGNEEGYLKRVSLEASNDLNYWRTVVHNATLSELDYANHTLKKNTIDLDNGRYKYLRFIWNDDPNGLQINTVRAMLNSITRERQKTWTTVSGERSEKDKHIIEFDTGGTFPIEEINILLPEDNTLIEAILRSRSDKKARWRTHYTGLLYKLNMKGTRLEQGPVHIRATTDRYWQLEVKDKDSLGTELPQFTFAWEPNELYFLARGDGPYTLAFGNASAGSPGKPVDAFMHVLSEDQQSELIQMATLGNRVSLKGAEALQPDREIPWQRILLWSILIIGVLTVATMAFRLFRQINHSG